MTTITKPLQEVAVEIQAPTFTKVISKEVVHPSMAFLLLPQNTAMQDVIGQRDGLSETDIYKINRLYNCPNNILGSPGHKRKRSCDFEGKF